MDLIAGAKLLVDRIGEQPANDPVQIHGDALPLFHWCNVNPATPLIASADKVAPTDAPADFA
jgi:uncharacterized protein YcsI (UPF0317 family)